MSFGNSRPVVSTQTAVPDKLPALLSKYWQTTSRKPLQEHNVLAFEEAQQWLARQQQHGPRPLVLDACCGVGRSTGLLAEAYPDALVIGIDKSAARVSKHMIHAGTADNSLLLRCDLIDFLRLAVAADWRCERQYLLYPNPYPKAEQLQKRWYAMDCFKYFLQLGGVWTIRSNWQQYLVDMQFALDYAGIKTTLSAVKDQVPLTLFEEKYQASGQTCYQLQSESIKNWQVPCKMSKM